MSAPSVHDDWLSLIEISGPFLAVPVLKEAFPQGLEELDATKRKRLRQAYEEWREALELEDAQFAELHVAWLNEVLSRGLELDEDGKGDVLKRADWCAANLKASLPEHGVTLSPDLAVVDEQGANKPLMLIQTYAQEVDLDATLKLDGWAAIPADRMVALCRSLGCRLGLVTNGERWMVVDAPVGAVTTFASWYARIWSQEPITLQAFVHLLGIRRFFVDESEQLPALFDRSLKFQDEVTDALGEQVRRAVEVLIQALDKADQDRSRELLRGVKEAELYEAALTVMMRLVFLLSAEERGLLLLGDERYEANYALSTLRMQLRAESDEILERRWDAWSRLLAVFRAVYGGIKHENLRLPALGGSLFDPDRFPFLEGRAKGSDWRIDVAKPLPIDNRTVLLLLEAIQQFQGRTLSYRALDVEQIGYVYEGLLERTVKRTAEVTLELDATKSAQSPWVTLAELESARLDGAERLAELLQQRSGSSASRVRNDLNKSLDNELSGRLLTACNNDEKLRDRIKPFGHLVRTDPWGYPLIYPAGAFIVTTGSDRRETGTHYTPKSLTEAIVAETLTPIAYIGPVEGRQRVDWALRSPADLLELKVCDPAMGSGAFLVQACRWLADRLLEAWAQCEVEGKMIGVDGLLADTNANVERLPRDTEARTIAARRLVAERCLYGVDLNPLAVELAKLSIWLVTLAKDRPFGFLDHSLRCGDSLLGIHRLDQLTQLSMNPSGQDQLRLFSQNIEQAVCEAIELRSRLREMPIRDIHDVEAMAYLDAAARRRLEVPDCICDAFIGEVFESGGHSAGLENALASLAIQAGQAIDGDESALESMRRRSVAALSIDMPTNKSARRPFHWPLEFPEVFVGPRSGFDAIVGNPPFLGGRQMPGKLGIHYPEYLRTTFGTSGPADLVCFFFRRATMQIIGRSGCFGLIGTNSLSETVNSEAALRPAIASGITLYRAYKSVPWPGVAAVSISMIYGFNGSWQGKRLLDDECVEEISQGLDAAGHAGDIRLIGPRFPTSQGVNLFGQAFVIDGDKVMPLAQKNPEIKNYLRIFVNGDILNDTPSYTSTQHVIDFGEKNKTEIDGCHEIIDELSEKISYERRNQTRQVHESRPWLHWDKRTRFLEAARQRKQFFALTIVSAYFVVHKVSTISLYAHGVQLFDSESQFDFAILQSSVHEYWARFTSGSLGQTLRYTASKCWATLPWPLNVSDETANVAGQLLTFRSELMERRGCGSNSIYEEFHDPKHHSADINRLREMHQALDRKVMDDYGWSDICTNYQMVKQGKATRLSISEDSRRELIKRLVLLNAKNAPPETKRKQKALTTTRTSLPGQSDFNFESIASEVGTQLPCSLSVVDFLKQRPGWHAKADIVIGAGISEREWSGAIAELTASGEVERQGEKRGTRYRVKQGSGS
ncbi:Eco57I restriction-modification methylase domain-containing protein [Acidovorax sp. LjRoot117]|uniref:Eco57I restriction-modification methylase domain-containing protein n=1 Tax=Acidovorax sp. LjRoot117 TaxID=3342255 RepID=UPI003ECCD482